jgi:hypothetical protein
MESAPQGKLVEAVFPIRERVDLSTPFPHPFGAFPKGVPGLMLSITEDPMRARAQGLIAALELPGIFLKQELES